MASQCHSLSVHSSTSKVLPLYACSAPSASPSPSCSLRVHQPSIFLRGQRLQPQRLRPRPSHSSGSGVHCASSTFGSSSNQEPSKSGPSTNSNALSTSLLARAPEPIRVFPWATAGSLFLHRLLHQFGTVGKWLAVPVLAVSMLSELSYTLLQEKVLVILAGMVGGVAFAGMMKDTAIELSAGSEAGDIPWHLVLLGLFFGALKFVGPYLPTWGRISVPHFANGGLWHVIKLVIDWRKQHAAVRTVRHS